jgi:hemimethylated DNA binding protein
MDTPLKSKARFRLGQIVYHSKFRYRGVIVDADPFFPRNRRMVR